MAIIQAFSDIHGNMAAFKDALDRIDLGGGNRLVLLGDYIDEGEESGQVLRHIHSLQKEYGAQKVIVLRGNHEEAFLQWIDVYGDPHDREVDEYGLLRWDDWLNTDEDFRTFKSLITQQQWEAFCQACRTMSNDELNTAAAKMVLEANEDIVSWLRRLPYFFETEKQIFAHAGIDEEAGDWWQYGTAEEIFVGKYPPTTGPFYKDIVAGHVSSSRLAGAPDFHGIFHDGASHYYIDGDVRTSGRIPILLYDEEKGIYSER